MTDKIRVLYLTIRYWLEGDKWATANALAIAIVYGWKGYE